MGPKRSRSAPYHLDQRKPENWTDSKLKTELLLSGIDLPTNDKRSRLVSLFKETNATATGDNVDEIGESRPYVTRT